MSADGKIQIRNARADEYPAIRELTRAAYAEFGQVMTPAAWAGLDGAVRSALEIRGDAEWIVAERDGEVVGSVMLFPPAADAYKGAAPRAAWPELRLLAVAPAERGQGIGAALVRECMRRAREAGATELGLHTSRSMEVAMQMYERMGFERAPEYDFQPQGAELVKAYRLRLN